MLGSSFVQVGSGEALDISDAVKVSGLNGLDEGLENFVTTIMVWTGTSYDTYGYVNAEEAAAWEWPDAADKWLLEDMTDIAAVQVPAGDGFWVNAAQTGTITLVGQVPAAAETTINVNPGFNLLSSPYAKDINIQDIKVNGLAGLDEGLENFVTTIMVWTGTSYDTYGYVNAEEAAAWEWPDAADKWLLEDMTDIANVTIPAGSGFWLNTAGTGSVTFTK